MQAAIILAIIDGAIAILEAVLPELSNAMKRGTITAAEQQVRLDKLNALRLDAAFAGPEWTPSPKP